MQRPDHRDHERGKEQDRDEDSGRDVEARSRGSRGERREQHATRQRFLTPPADSEGDGDEHRCSEVVGDHRSRLRRSRTGLRAASADWSCAAVQGAGPASAGRESKAKASKAISAPTATPTSTSRPTRGSKICSSEDTGPRDQNGGGESPHVRLQGNVAGSDARPVLSSAKAMKLKRWLLSICGMSRSVAR